MNAFSQYLKDDDDNIADEAALPPGEVSDDFDVSPDDTSEQTSAPDDDLDGDPFADDDEAQEALPSEERNWEAEARKMGWKDPAETGKGIDAKSFVLGSRRVGEKLLTQVDDLTKTIRDMERQRSRSEMAARVDGYRRAMQAIKAEQARAKNEYDVEAMDRAYRQEMELIDQARQEAAQIRQAQEAEARAAQDAPDPVWDGWVAENRWYETDKELQAAADSVGAVFAQQGLTGRALMDKVTEALRIAHPQKFTNQRKRNAPVNDSNRARRSESTASLNSMPNEIRAAFSDFYDEHSSEFKSKEHARKYFMDLMKG